MQMLLASPVAALRLRIAAGRDAGERIGMAKEVPQFLHQCLQAPVEPAYGFGECLILRGFDRSAARDRIAQ